MRSPHTPGAPWTHTPGAPWTLGASRTSGAPHTDRVPASCTRDTLQAPLNIPSAAAHVKPVTDAANAAAGKVPPPQQQPPPSQAPAAAVGYVRPQKKNVPSNISSRPVNHGITLYSHYLSRGSPEDPSLCPSYYGLEPSTQVVLPSGTLIGSMRFTTVLHPCHC